MIPLYEHQREALGKLKNGSILCGGVGSGKSRTSLAYYILQQGGDCNEVGICTLPEGQVSDLYIITTARKRDTYEWESEMAPFLLSTSESLSRYKNKVVVDSWNNIKKYVDVSNAFFIFDEQRVVGSGAWVKAFISITRKNRWILLSATPGDTWTDYIPVFVANGFYRNKTEFQRRHVIYSRYTKYPKVDRYIDEQHLNRLRNHILVNMPYQKPTTPHDVDLYVTYDLVSYKDTMRNWIDPFTDDEIESSSQMCYVLRKIVNSDDSRLLKVLEITESTPRVIIFYNFDYELDLLRSLEYVPGTEVAEWNGHKHEPIPDSDRWVYLVQYSAGAEGWNCILTNAIIFFSQNYSYKVMVQASGRIDRLNTPYTDLYFYHLKSRSSIDLAISKALRDKKQFNDRGFVDRIARKTHPIMREKE